MCKTLEIEVLKKLRVFFKIPKVSHPLEILSIEFLRGHFVGIYVDKN